MTIEKKIEFLKNLEAAVEDVKEKTGIFLIDTEWELKRIIKKLEMENIFGFSTTGDYETTWVYKQSFLESLTYLWDNVEYVALPEEPLYCIDLSQKAEFLGGDFYKNVSISFYQDIDMTDILEELKTYNAKYYEGQYVDALYYTPEDAKKVREAIPEIREKYTKIFLEQYRKEKEETEKELKKREGEVWQSVLADFQKLKEKERVDGIK